MALSEILSLDAAPQQRQPSQQWMVRRWMWLAISARQEGLDLAAGLIQGEVARAFNGSSTGGFLRVSNRVRAPVKENSNFVLALSALEQEARGAGDPLLQALFAERARELLLLGAQVQLMRESPLAALCLSERARRVPGRVFAAERIDDGSMNAERCGEVLLRSVPRGITVIHQDLEGDRLLTWVVRDGAMHFVATPAVAADLEADIDQFREDLKSSRPAKSIVEDGKRLYAILIKPARAWIAGEGLLVYSPPPALRGIPVAALHDGRQFLFQSRPMAVTRAMSSLGHFSGASMDRGTVFVVLPPTANGSSPLGSAAGEVSFVARLYADATALSGESATLGAFAASAPGFDVIHLAGHGSSDGRPLQNAMEFGRLHLCAKDVLHWRLTRSPLVILAGCRTDDETEGRSTLSLASAFVVAGASGVVGSLFDVEDESTKNLMVDFHRQLVRGVPPAEALRRAQRAAIARTGEPATWAAFQLQM
ncbi:MAG: CHAT domain-containing protein [Acidobacteriota bacterium]